MGFLTDHPYTAITVTIDRLVTDQYEEDDVAGVFELIENIRASSTGPTEAARAIRKKLKYGNVHNQLRALTILDSLIENGGKRFQSNFADEPLLERLRLLAADSFTDPAVKQKVSRLFVKWANSYKNTAGMGQVTQLYKQLPQRKRKTPVRQQRFASLEDDMEEEDEDEEEEEEESHHHQSHPPSRSGASSSSRRESPAPAMPSRRGVTSPGGSRSASRVRSDREPRASSSGPKDRFQSNTAVDRYQRSKKKKATSTSSGARPFDIQKEKPLLTQTLAESGTEATNLNNALKLINREKELATDNMRATECFNKCRKLRRMVLRYIQHIESEDYIGSLLHANDELVAALQLYDKMSQPIDEDSDSDYDSESSGVDEFDRNLDRHKPSTAHPAPTHAPAHAKFPTREELAHKRKPPPVPVKSEVLSEFKSKMVISPARDKFPGEVVDEEDSNPFGDDHKIETPAVEKKCMTW
ncbi:uncharacterized protein V1516DRAFT_673574 [Lipomyces oligophaga]|uniref:uncharacterized protein n=1 Tax=Lipomyces oligophaga TaxID=45792 RepID=UPI0034CF405C